MSTNKSKHLKLHLWVPQDDFLRAEFNENFTALDTAVKAEETARINAVSEEATARTNAISAETSARKTAIQTLKNSIASTGSSSSTAVSDLRTELTASINAVKTTANAAYSPSYKPFSVGRHSNSSDSSLTLGFKPSLLLLFAHDKAAAMYDGKCSVDLIQPSFSSTGVSWHVASSSDTTWTKGTSYYIAFR